MGQRQAETGGPAGGGAVRLGYRLGAADVGAAARLAWKDAGWGVGDTIAYLASLAVAAAAARAVAGSSVLAFAAVAACAAVLPPAAGAARAGWLMPLLARRRYAAALLLDTPLALEADAAAIRFSSEGVATALSWSLLRGWREDERVMLLDMTTTNPWVVPKRAVGAADLDALRRLVTAAGERADAGAPDGRVLLFAGDFAAAGIEGEALLAASPSFIPTREDDAAALRLDLRRRWRRPRSLAAPALLAACCAGIAALSDPLPGSPLAQLPFGPRLGAAAAALAAVLVFRLGLYAFMPVWLRRGGALRVGQPRRVELARGGLRCVTPAAAYRISWSRIRWAADASVLLLYSGDALLLAIPTRAVDARFLAAIRELTAPLRRR